MLNQVSNALGLDKAKQITKESILDKLPVGLGGILIEGVDIVEVNQVIMLRPTQSPIVFI
jgi:superfamily II DNA or RNA helicase